MAEGGTRSRRLVLLVALVVFAVYLPDLRNGFVYDDHEVVLQQDGIRSLGALLQVFAEPHGLPQSQLPYYRAIPRATLLAQKGLHGDVAWLFHLGNAALMAAAAVAAFALLRTPVFGLSAGAAAWGAIAFGVHPVASECVHPIASGRETAIPGLFMLAALACWLRGRRHASHGATAAALWSKEQAITTPLLVAWADWLGLAPGAARWSVATWLRRMAPFAALVAAYLFVRGQVVPRGEGDDDFAARFAAHWAAHPLGPLESLLFAVQSWFAPRAVLLYEPAFATWFSPARAAAALAAFGAVLALAWRGARERRVVVFWLGWIPLAMGLNANLLPIEAPFAERYLLVSSVAFAALCAAAGDAVASRRPRAAAAIGVLVVAAFAAATLHRGGYYHDELAFTAQWAATSPRHANAQASHGAALARAGRDAEAIAALREAVRLEPALAAAHYNLGVVLARAGQRDAAIDAFRATLAAWSGDADAHFALGVLLAQRGERDAALGHLREALALRPAFPEAVTALRELEARPH
jgi:tetratricopeptide (TPR) repeat protein